eukprot:Nk52_evm3s384 gene=Nk52_evmTU3s384
MMSNFCTIDMSPSKKVTAVGILISLLAETVSAQWQDGRSTYFNGETGGNCGFGTIPVNSFPTQYIAAPNDAFYNNAKACGRCYEVECTGAWKESFCGGQPACKEGKSVVLQISDRCPAAGNEEWCSGDMTHFDLSQQAFDAIANTNCGAVRMRYRPVDCQFKTNMKLRFEGSNKWYVQVTVMNANGNGGVTKVELKQGGDWISLSRSPYNAWTGSLGSGISLPATFRITGNNGEVLTADNVLTSDPGSQILDFGKNFRNGN